MKTHCEVESIYLPAVGYSLKSLWRNVQFVIKSQKLQKCDVVHITGTESYLLPFLKRHKVLFTVHDIASLETNCSGLKRMFKRRAFIETIKYADFVTFISQKSMHETLDAISLELSRVKVIENPLERSYKFSPREFNVSLPTILHVGTKPNKNLSRSVEALKGIACRLRIVGVLSSQQKEELDRSGIDYSNVWNISDQQMLEEYKECDIVNFPSTYEGFGMPIVEGQAVGRVVVTSQIEPMKSVGGKGVVLVDPYSVDSMRKGYESIIEDKSLRDATISMGVKNSERYDLYRITKEYFEIYKGEL